MRVASDGICSLDAGKIMLQDGREDGTAAPRRIDMKPEPGLTADLP